MRGDIANDLINIQQQLVQVQALTGQSQQRLSELRRRFEQHVETFGYIVFQLDFAEPLPLDVFCVERGRWAGPSTEFSAAKLFVHPSVREQAAVERKQEEVWAAVRQRCPTLSRATVYNTLNLFAEKGLLKLPPIKEGVAVFDPNVAPHHHFIDEETGIVPEGAASGGRARATSP